MIYLIIAFLIFWKTFISNMEKDLWKNKSVLSVLTPELIMSVEKIRGFIIDNSSTLLSTKLNTE